MYSQTRFDLENRVRIHELSGEVNLPEFHELLQKLYASPQFDPDLNALWDIRQADFSKVSPDDVRALMNVVATHWGKDGKCRAAIVVGGLAEYGICRMYESQFGPAAPCKIKIFTDLDAAWQWFAAGDEIARNLTSRSLIR